ncbi:Serine/threonine exchanger SteT [bacterium HR36]|nr:Serine/threonine exchanger SteT [bacterium HR36]
MQQQSPNEPRASLSVFDAVCIIVGIVIGSSIYEVPPLIFANVSGPWMGLWAWLLGGILALIGAFVYAELGTTYPRIGGDYVYLTRAFGRLVGFLFGWAQLTAILTASIGSMAFVFANAADNLFFAELGASEDRRALLAAASVTVLSLLNIAGVVLGKWTQNLLSVVKVLGLGGIIVAGLALAQPGALRVPAEHAAGPLGFGFAMIMVLYAYGGWNDAAFVAGEVRNVRRNLPLALFFGVGLITAIYLLVNLAYLLGLGFQGVQEPDAPGRLLHAFVGPSGSAAMHLIIIVSALGAVNGLIFTGARIYSALGADHRLFAWLAQWHPRLGSPHWSLLLQWAIALLMIGGVGTAHGRRTIDALVGYGRYLVNGMPADLSQLLDGQWENESGTLELRWARANQQPRFAVRRDGQVLVQGTAQVHADRLRFQPEPHDSPSSAPKIPEEWQQLLNGEWHLQEASVRRLVLRNHENQTWSALRAEIPWRQYLGGFGTLVAATAPIFWLFFLLAGLSLFKLREIDSDRERPFSTPFYPIVPFIFCLTCAWMLYNSLTYARWLSVIFAVPVLAGILVYWLSNKPAQENS